MVGEHVPADDQLENAEWLDEQLREDPSAPTDFVSVPDHIEAGIRFLRNAFPAPHDRIRETEPKPTGRVFSKPDSIGRFQLHERLGEGSFGVVYRAFDTVLKREVALKLPRLVTALSDDLTERFLRESEAAARLHHPQIVQVFEAGFADSTCYLAAELCPGKTLGAWRKENPEPVESKAAARLMLRLADAVDHAHQARILHRDLKPGNILISPEDGQTIGPDPSVLESAKITDFGLARFLNEGTAANSGGLAGTIAYMAPEQTGLRPGFSLGPACDVFALGVILYELLTGLRPHDGDNPVDALRRICETDPASPRRFVPTISRDLESICLRCLQKDPARRYASAGSLRDDLQRYLDGRITEARPLTIVEKTVRATRRHPAWATILGLIIVALVGGAVAVSYHFRELGKSIAAVNEQRELVQAREREVTDLLYVADLRVGLIALGQGDQETFERQMAKYEDKPDVRGIEWEFLKHVVPEPEKEIAAHQGPIYSSAVSPDGNLLATAGQDRVVRLWNVDRFKLAAELNGHEDEINDLAFHPKGRLLATSSDDHTVRIWDLEKQKLLRTLPHSDVVYGVAYSPDGKMLATGGRGKVLRIWTEEGDSLGAVDGFNDTIEQLVFAPDGLLGMAVDRQPQVWDLSSRKLVTKFNFPKAIDHIAFSPDGRYFTGGSTSQDIIVWDRETKERLAVWRGHRGWIHHIQFTTNGESIVTCGKDGSVRFWPLDNLSLDEPMSDEKNRYRRAGVHVFQAHPRRTWSMALLPKHRRVVTTGHQGLIRVWKQTRIFARRFGDIDTDHGVYNVRFSQDGRKAFVTKRHVTSIWDVETRKLLRELPGLPVSNNAQMAVSKGDRWVAVALMDNRIAVDSIEATTPRLFLEGHEAVTTAIEFSPLDERLLVSAAEDGTIRLWNVSTGEQLAKHSIAGSDGPIAVKVSADGKWLVHSNGQETVVRDFPTWEVVARWKDARGKATSLAMSTSNRLLASSYRDHTIELRELPSGRLTGLLAGHRDVVFEVVFSRDGQTLFSTSADNTLRAWHVPSQQEIGILFQETVLKLDLSPDGRKLLVGLGGRGSGTQSSRLLIWEAPSRGAN